MQDVLDTCTDGSGLTLASHVTDSGHIWTLHPSVAGTTMVISNANRVRINASSSSAAYYLDWVPPTADYDVTADIVVLSASGRIGVMGRAVTSAATFYLWRYNFTGGVYELLKSVAGASTVLASVPAALAVGNVRTLKLTFRGSVITGYVDGVQQAQVSDTAITAAGRAGLHGAVGTDATGIHVDNVTTRAVVPVNTGLPVVTGNAYPEQVLSCSTGAWTNAPTLFSYQWLRDGVAIVGATADSYVVQVDDGGHSLSCRVVAINADGSSAPATSNALLAFGAAYAVWLMSGGNGNTNPVASLGGAPATAYGGAPSTLFPNVSSDQAVAGDIRYRCVYIKNTHPSLSWSPKVFVKSDTSSPHDEIEIGLEPGAVNAAAQAIADETTPPAGVAFSHPTTQAGGLAVGTLAPGEVKALWVRRTVNAGAEQTNPDTSTLRQADAILGADYVLAYAIASPPRTQHVFEGPESGQAGVYQFSLWLMEGETAIAVFPRSPDAISELAAGSGIYIAARPVLTVPGRYVAVWDTGSLEPGNVYLSDYTIDDLLEITTDITTGQIADAVEPVIRREAQNAALLR